MSNNFVNGLDRQVWCPVNRDMNNAHAIGVNWCSDKRSDVSRNPFLYQFVGNTILNRYNFITKSQGLAINPIMGGTSGSGATSEFVPSRALEGAIGTANSTTKINTTTVMPAVGVNMMANRGGSGDYGYKIRIIGKSIGKIEERYIVANTGGTTPTFWLDNPLTFTPTSVDYYEILAGAVYMLTAGVLAANIFRSYEVGSNALTSLANTNLPATIGTDSYMIALDEQYTPFDVEPGTGFVKGELEVDSNQSKRYALAATAVGASSITGQATGGDSVILANEYRNFQIRVVRDLVNPTAVGQRRIIASNTVGPSPVYTLGTAWTVTPSTSAKYVIEYPNVILLRSSATNLVYTYNYNRETINNGTNNIVANAWSTTYFATAPAVVGSGCLIAPSFGIQPDVGRNARHSFTYFFRGGNTSTIDMLDIAGAINGAWQTAIVYDGSAILFNTGSSGDYAPCDQEGRFFYCNAYVANVNNQQFRFDVKNRVLSPHTPTSQLQTGAATVGNRMTTYAILKRNIADPLIIDEKFTGVFLQMCLTANAYELVTQV